MAQQALDLEALGIDPTKSEVPALDLESLGIDPTKSEVPAPSPRAPLDLEAMGIDPTKSEEKPPTNYPSEGPTLATRLLAGPISTAREAAGSLGAALLEPIRAVAQSAGFTGRALRGVGTDVAMGGLSGTRNTEAALAGEPLPSQGQMRMGGKAAQSVGETIPNLVASMVTPGGPLAQILAYAGLTGLQESEAGAPPVQALTHAGYTALVGSALGKVSEFGAQQVRNGLELLRRPEAQEAVAETFDLLPEAAKSIIDRYNKTVGVAAGLRIGQVMGRNTSAETAAAERAVARLNESYPGIGDLIARNQGQLPGALSSEEVQRWLQSIGSSGVLSLYLTAAASPSVLSLPAGERVQGLKQAFLDSAIFSLVGIPHSYMAGKSLRQGGTPGEVFEPSGAIPSSRQIEFPQAEPQPPREPAPDLNAPGEIDARAREAFNPLNAPEPVPVNPLAPAPEAPPEPPAPVAREYTPAIQLADGTVVKGETHEDAYGYVEAHYGRDSEQARGKQVRGWVTPAGEFLTMTEVARREMQRGQAANEPREVTANRLGEMAIDLPQPQAEPQNPLAAPEPAPPTALQEGGVVTAAPQEPTTSGVPLAETAPRPPAAPPQLAVPVPSGPAGKIRIRRVGPIIPERPDGVFDVIDAIKILGDVRAMSRADFADKGDYDGYAEAFGYGQARLLRNVKSKNRPDELVQMLADPNNNLGTVFRFDSTSDMYDAVKRASEERIALFSPEAKRNRAAEARQQEFMDAALANKGKSPGQMGPETKQTSILAKGDRFKIKGAEIEIKAVDDRAGEVIATDGPRYGRTIVIPKGQTLYPDKGSWRPAGRELHPELEAGLVAANKAATEYVERALSGYSPAVQDEARVTLAQQAFQEAEKYFNKRGTLKGFSPITVIMTRARNFMRRQATAPPEESLQGGERGGRPLEEVVPAQPGAQEDAGLKLLEDFRASLSPEELPAYDKALEAFKAGKSMRMKPWLERLRQFAEQQDIGPADVQMARREPPQEEGPTVQMMSAEPRPGQFRMKGEYESYSDYQAARKAAGFEPLPGDEPQSKEEIERITAENRAKLAEAKAKRNESAVRWYRFKVLKGEDMLRYYYPEPPPEEGPTAEMMREGESIQTRSMNAGRAARMFGRKLYSAETPKTVAKETFQNSVDAVFKRQKKDGTKPEIITGTEGPIVVTGDNGIGMNPDTILNVFLPGFTSGKGVGEGGGFGIAKLGFLGSTKAWVVISKTDEYTSVLKGTGEGYLRWYDNETPPRVTLNAGHPIELDPDLVLIYAKTRPDDTERGTWSMFDVGSDNDVWTSNQWIKQAKPFVKGVDFRLALISDTKVPYQPIEDLLRTAWKEGMPRALDVYAGEVRPELKSYGLVKTITTPSARIDVIAPAGAKMVTTRWLNISVLNHSILQFDTAFQFKDDITVPEGMAINVIPTVLAESEKYPFTTSREAITGDVKDAVSAYLNDIGMEARKAMVDKYSNAVTKAPVIAGTKGLRFLDVSAKVDPELVKEITNSGAVARVMQDVKTIQDAILNILTKRYPTEGFGRASFAGLLFGGNAYGVHFGKTTGPSQIYHDIFLSMETVREEIEKLWKDNGYTASPEDHQFTLQVYEAFLRRVAGVGLHEALHQTIHSEGEALSRGLTFKGGDLIDAVLDARIVLPDELEASALVHDILEYESRLTVARDKEAAKSFFSSQGGYYGYTSANPRESGEGANAAGGQTSEAGLQDTGQSSRLLVDEGPTLQFARKPERGLEQALANYPFLQAEQGEPKAKEVVRMGAAGEVVGAQPRVQTAVEAIRRRAASEPTDAGERLARDIARRIQMSPYFREQFANRSANYLAAREIVLDSIATWRQIEAETDAIERTGTPEQIAAAREKLSAVRGYAFANALEFYARKDSFDSAYDSRRVAIVDQFREAQEREAEAIERRDIAGGVMESITRLGALMLRGSRDTGLWSAYRLALRNSPALESALSWIADNVDADAIESIRTRGVTTVDGVIDLLTNYARPFFRPGRDTLEQITRTNTDTLRALARIMLASEPITSRIADASRLAQAEVTSGTASRVKTELADAIRRGNWDQALNVFRRGVGDTAIEQDQARTLANFYAQKSRRAIVSLQALDEIKGLGDQLAADPEFRRNIGDVMNALNVRDVMSVNRNLAIRFNRVNPAAEPVTLYLGNNATDWRRNREELNQLKQDYEAYIANPEAPNYRQSRANGMMADLEMLNVYLDPARDPSNARFIPGWTQILKKASNLVAMGRLVSVPQFAIQHGHGMEGAYLQQALAAYSSFLEIGRGLIDRHRPDVTMAMRDAAEKAHNMSPDEYRTAVYNAIVSTRQNFNDPVVLRVGDKIGNGQTVKPEDIVYIKAWRAFERDVIDRFNNLAQKKFSAFSIIPKGIVFDEGGKLRLPFAVGEDTTSRYFPTSVEDWVKDWKAAKGDRARLIQVLNEDPWRFVLGYVYGVSAADYKSNYSYPLETRDVLADIRSPAGEPLTGFEDLADRIFQKRAERDDITEPETLDDIVDKLLIDFNTVFTKLERLNPEDAAIKVERADVDVLGGVSSYNTPRGELVMPPMWYDYGGVTDSDMVVTVKKAEVPFALTYLNALETASRAVGSIVDDMEKQYKKQPTTYASETEREMRAGNLIYSYAEANRYLTELQQQYASVYGMLHQKTDQNLSERPYEMRNRGLLGVVTASALGTSSAMVRNLVGGTYNLYRTRKRLLGEGITAAMLGTFRQTIKGITEETLYQTMRAISPLANRVDVPLVRSLARSIGEFVLRRQAVLDEMRLLGLNINYPLGKMVKAIIATQDMGGVTGLRTPPTKFGRAKNRANAWLIAYARAVGQAGVNFLDSRLNMFSPGLVSEMEDRFRAIALRYGPAMERMAEEGGYDPRDATDSRNKLPDIALAQPPGLAGMLPEKMTRQHVRAEAARLREFFRTQLGRNLDKVLMDYYFRWKDGGRPDNLPFFTDPERNQATLAAAGEVNLATYANRLSAAKALGRLGQMLLIFMQYGVWQVTHQARDFDRLSDEHWSNALIRRIPIALTAAIAAVIFGLITQESTKATGKALGKVSPFPTLSDAGGPKEAGVALLSGAADMVPFIGSAVNASLNRGYNTGFDVGNNLFALNLARDAYNTTRKIWETGGSLRPVQEFANRWIYPVNIIGRSLPNFSGLTELSQARNILASGARATGLEGNLRKPQAGGGSDAVYTPATPIVDAAVNAIGRGDMEGFKTAFDKLVEYRTGLGDPKPEQSALRQIKSRNPMRSVFGAKLAPGEEELLFKNLSADRGARLQTVLDNFDKAEALVKVPTPKKAVAGRKTRSPALGFRTLRKPRGFKFRGLGFARASRASNRQRTRDILKVRA